MNDMPIWDKQRAVCDLLQRVKFKLFDTSFFVQSFIDKKHKTRIYIQVCYYDKCRDTSTLQKWKGRKWYLSDHMIADEIIKTAYAACKAVVEHEIMEGFTVDGKVLFNPHVSFEALLSISSQEVRRL